MSSYIQTKQSVALKRIDKFSVDLRSEVKFSTVTSKQSLVHPSRVKQSGAETSKAKFLNMEHKKAVSMSRLRKLVPNDLFDKQMKRARQRDINSRKSIFDNQTEIGLERSEYRKQLTSSTY